MASSAGSLRWLTQPHPWQRSHHTVALALLAATLLGLGVLVTSMPLPRARGVADTPASDFSEGRAHAYLANFTCPRGVCTTPHQLGTLANELAVDSIHQWLLAQAAQSTARAGPLELEVDVQTAAGCYFYPRRSSYACYQGLRNVVGRVKRRGAPGDPDALLLSSHFDSVPEGPSVSDVGAGAATLIEAIAVVLARAAASPELTTSDMALVFNINNGEEMGLLGSHAFITQHKWAKSCKTVLNIEGAGVGGNAMVFQVGPGSPVLGRLWMSHVPYPVAEVSGQDLFQNGLVPSDTDFRVYRDVGGIGGIDEALTEHGQLYHTDRDDLAHLTPGTLQALGENLVAFVAAVQARMVSDPRFLAGLEWSERGGQAVFYGVPALGALNYSSWLAAALAVGALAVGGVVMRKRFKAVVAVTERGDWRKAVAGEVAMVLSLVAVVAGGVAVAVAVAWVMQAVNPMGWYKSFLQVLALYGTAALLGQMLTIWATSRALVWGGMEKAHVYSAHSSRFVVTAASAVLLAVMTLAGLGSAYLMFWLLVTGTAEAAVQWVLPPEAARDDIQVPIERQGLIDSAAAALAAKKAHIPAWQRPLANLGLTAIPENGTGSFLHEMLLLIHPLKLLNFALWLRLAAVMSQFMLASLGRSRVYRVDLAAAVVIAVLWSPVSAFLLYPVMKLQTARWSQFRPVVTALGTALALLMVWSALTFPYSYEYPKRLILSQVERVGESPQLVFETVDGRSPAMIVEAMGGDWSTQATPSEEDPRFQSVVVDGVTAATLPGTPTCQVTRVGNVATVAVHSPGTGSGIMLLPNARSVVEGGSLWGEGGVEVNAVGTARTVFHAGHGYNDWSFTLTLKPGVATPQLTYLVTYDDEPWLMAPALAAAKSSLPDWVALFSGPTLEVELSCQVV